VTTVGAGPRAVEPREWFVPPADVLLADGTIAVIRTLRPEDRAAVEELHESVSVDTLRLRFFTASRLASRQYVEHVFDETSSRSVAMVGVVGRRIAALATAEVLSEDTAEVAFLVSDQDHGRGLGSLLLEHLAALCRTHGITRFEADVLAENYGMLRVFRGAGFAISRRTEEGEVSVELRTDVSAAALDAADSREWHSEARSLRPLLAPHSVAVVGVRRAATGLGSAMLEAISGQGFTGSLHVVHPAAVELGGTLAGLPCHPSVAAIPEPVDLVVVAVPADQVYDVMSDACEAGVGAAVIVSSGFAGPSGTAFGGDLLALARAHSVRVVGPNSQGVLALATSQEHPTRLNASIARTLPEPGGLAIASQSGGVGFTLLDLARAQPVGVHSFVSLGAKLDVSSNDLLAAWGDDERVTVAALYLESFGNALKFARTARRFGERKPLLAVVGGRAADERVGVDAVFAQAGVIGCRSAAELIETAAVLATQPRPDGFRVGVVTNAGGMGLLAANQADQEGLVVPVLSPGLQEAVSADVAIIGAANPVDLGADLTPRALATTVRRLAESDEVDAVVVVLVPTSFADPAALLAATAEATRDATKPVLAVASDATSARTPADLTVFRTVEDGVGALARSMRYAAWRRVPADELEPEPSGRAAQARAWVTDRLAARGGEAEWLPAAASGEFLAPYGVTQVGVSARGPSGARTAAEELGFPVVVKVADPQVLHKTDRGLVRVGLATPEAVADAVRGFATELGNDDPAQVEVHVQPVLDGVEVACNIVRDEVFGSLVRVAAGGVATDVLRDEVHLLPPVTRSDAARALRGLRLWPLLDGYRGNPRVDIEALESLVVAVARLAADVPQVAELFLNPVFVRPDGVHCVDVNVRIRSAEAPDVGFPRRLRPSD